MCEWGGGGERREEREKDSILVYVVHIYRFSSSKDVCKYSVDTSNSQATPNTTAATASYTECIAHTRTKRASLIR